MPIDFGGQMEVRWKKRLKVMRVSSVAIIILLIALTLFAGFTVYGNKVGNFVINVKNEELRLSLSVHEDMSDQTERLTFNGVSALGDNSYGFLPADIANGLGNKSVSGSYAAYGFYLINNSERKVDYSMDLRITGIVGDPLPIIRIMLIEGDKGVFDAGNRIFAQKEDSEEAERHLKEQLSEIVYYETEDFQLENNKIFSIKMKDLEKGDSQKFTLVMWIEGCDAECVNERLGGRVKLRLDITGY